jgi:hypothetical protein
MAVYGGRLHATGNVGRYDDRLSSFFALFYVLVRISYYVSQNYLKHVYDCFLMKFIEDINLTYLSNYSNYCFNALKIATSIEFQKEILFSHKYNQ